MPNILAALDFSEATPRILAEAEFLAQSTGGHLYLLHSSDSPNDEAILEDFAGRVRADGVEATAVTLHGPIADAILQKAEELKARLLVMGSHGSGLRKFFVGSVSEAVLKKAPCPVVLIRAYRE